MAAFGEEGDHHPHVVLHSNLTQLRSGRVPLRIHSECMTGDVFASRRCDCGAQLVAAMDHFQQHGGLLIYLRQEGRGIGLVEKLRAYNLQDEGMNTFEANVARGHAEDARQYGAAVAILNHLGVTSVSLLTNNPDKVRALEEAGLDVLRLPNTISAHRDNAAYLKAKADITGHWL